MTRRLQSSYSKSFPSFVLSLSFKSIHFCTIRFIAMFLKVCMHVIILLRLVESSLTAYYTFISSIFHSQCLHDWSKSVELQTNSYINSHLRIEDIFKQ